MQHLTFTCTLTYNCSCSTNGHDGGGVGQVAEDSTERHNVAGCHNTKGRVILVSVTWKGVIVWFFCVCCGWRDSVMWQGV